MKTKRILSVVIAISMLMSFLPVMSSASGYAEKIFLRLNSAQEAMMEGNPDYRVEMDYDNGIDSFRVLMVDVGNGYYYAPVNNTVNNINFRIWDTVNQSIIWGNGAQYLNSTQNCFSFEQDEHAGEWTNYVSDGQEHNRLLFFTPSNTWNEYYQDSTPRYSVSIVSNGKTYYKEMTPYGDGSYVTGNISGTRYTFGLMTNEADDPRSNVLKSASVSKGAQLNHFVLKENIQNSASGIWSVKTVDWNEEPSGGEGNEGEYPLPDEDVPEGAEIKWGYTTELEEGFATLNEVFSMNITDQIYIKLVASVELWDTIQARNGTYNINLNGNTIRGNQTIFNLYKSTMCIDDSQNGYMEMMGIEDTGYMFELSSSQLTVNGGRLHAAGAGHITMNDANSKVFINGGQFEGLVDSAINYSAGTLTLNGGNFEIVPPATDILYTGSSFNQNIEIIKVNAIDGATFCMPNIKSSVNVTTLGDEGILHVTDEYGADVEIMSAGTIYILNYKYRLTFVANGTTYYEYAVRNSPYALPVCNVAPEAGKVFAYWRADNQMYNAGDVISIERDMMFSAVWTNATIITINFKAEHSGETDSQQVSASAPYVLPECTLEPPAGQVFKAWKINGVEYSAGESVIFTQRTDVFAVWEDGISLIYISNNNLNETREFYFKAGSIVTLMENDFTANDGQSFTGWVIDDVLYNPGDEIQLNSATEVYAEWMNGFVVTYKANGGKGADRTFSYEEATEIILPENTYFNPADGHIFAGWSVNGERVSPNDAILVTTTTEILAVWAKQCTVSYLYRFTSESGNESVRRATESVLSGTNYVIKSYDELFAAPLLSLHRAKGWKDDKGKSYNAGDQVVIEGDTTFTLEYSTVYTVTLNPGNGVDLPAQYDVEVNGYFTLPSEKPAAPGESYYFEGWKKGTETTYYQPGQKVQITGVQGNTFTAVWTEYTPVSELTEIFQDGIQVGKEYSLPEHTMSLGSGKLVDITWNITNARGTNATIENNTLTATNEGSFLISYVAINASEDNTMVSEEFEIAVSNDFAISTYAQLREFIEIVNSGVMYANATLTNDIDMNGVETAPIGKVTHPYAGTFDGNGHIISNLNMKDSNVQALGFFGNVDNGTIKNLGIINIIVNESTSETGMLVGRISNSTVENVFISGELTFETQEEKGVACVIIDSEFKNCFTTDSIFATEATGTFANCFYLADDRNTDSVGENKTLSQFESGEIAHMLQGDQTENIWGQKIGTDTYPVLGGEKVYKYVTGYSNENIFGFVEKGQDYVTVNIPLEGTYALVFADYDGDSLKELEVVPVTVTGAKAEKVSITKNFNPDKIMLWQDITTLAPLCDALIIE